MDSTIPKAPEEIPETGKNPNKKFKKHYRTKRVSKDTEELMTIRLLQPNRFLRTVAIK